MHDGPGLKVRFAVSPGGGRFDADGLAAFATAAETLGFDTIWLSDVPLGPIGDPLVSLTYLAGTTGRLKLGANVVPIGRNPLLLARQLAQLDQLSGGRLLLSFVPGLDQPGERRALGYPNGDRGALMEATMGLLRQWWDGKPVDHDDYDRHRRRAPAPPGSARDLGRRHRPQGAGAGGPGVRRLADGGAHPGRGGPAAATRSSRRADELGRPIDPEHFGISIPYARTRRARRRGRGPADAPQGRRR